MKTRIVEIYVENSPSKWGVWIDTGRTVFGRKPVAVFDTLAEAQAYRLT